MSYQRNSREEAEYQKYVYSGDGVVLRNKLGLSDVAQIEIMERAYVETRLREGLPRDAHPHSYDGFKAIHRHLFQDVYDWAGKERTYTTGRGASPFAVPEHIRGWMQGRFELLKSENYLTDLSKRDFVLRAAEHVNEINAAHPSIDGNGRTQRVWLRLVAEKAGHTLTIRSQDRTRWNEASRVGFEKSDHAPMARLIDERLIDHKRRRNRGQNQNRDL